MKPVNGQVTVVVPGDLHLTTRDQPNYEAAVKVIGQINDVIRPDFVQFIGDNVQDAKEEQFELFKQLTDSLSVRHFALVGDHDVCLDANATVFRKWIGEPFGSFALRGFRFVRLNTLEIPRLGFSENQLHWLNQEFEFARHQHQQVVLFQHHYPYKVCETFAGPGIDRWRELVETHRPVAVVCGHTHYGQIANNGRNIAVAARSIGDPEGGAPGCLIIHLDDDDLAIVYRTLEDQGPLVLITHPRDSLLATDVRHIVRGDDVVRVRIWANETVVHVAASIDDGPRFELQPAEKHEWVAPLPGASVHKGEHSLRVDVRLRDGQRGHQQIRYFVDPTRRFTAVPGARPAVQTTTFC